MRVLECIGGCGLQTEMQEYVDPLELIGGMICKTCAPKYLGASLAPDQDYATLTRGYLEMITQLKEAS